MAKKIVLAAEPRGVFGEGILDTGETPKPGQLLTEKADGTYGLRAAATGTRDLILICRPDDLRGQTEDDAYVAGERVFFYTPAPGEEVHVLAKSGEDIDIAELLVAEVGGDLIATTGTPESEPFKSREDTGGALGSDTLIRVQYTGH